ncbi:unnamed protein product [Rangifer tarandus platyrhynchus]|uniref:Uncharacterized protein n=1 Tax=Rangifer tarandus platyrhynchus TaxID=3082113 RepID=A0AC59Z6I4_RANTA
MHVNLEKVAGRAGADLRGRAWAPPAPRAFVFAPDKGPSRRRSRTWRPCPAGHSAGWSDRSTRGSWSEKRTSGAVGGAVRDPGEWGLACASSAPSRSCPDLGRVVGDGTALLSAPFAALRGESFWKPGLGPMGRGLCSRGRDSAAPAASESDPPARAELPTSAPQARSGSRRLLRTNTAGPRALPGNRTPVVAFGRRSRDVWRSLPRVWVAGQPRRPHPSARTPRSSADAWSSDDCATLRSRSSAEMGVFA